MKKEKIYPSIKKKDGEIRVTPFQNIFLKLYNTPCLAKPTFPDQNTTKT